MERVKKKTYLFITDTDYMNGKLTGAHRRFLELVHGISKNDNVILVSYEIPQLDDISVTQYLLENTVRKTIPHHINSLINKCKKLLEIKNDIKYDYAISFGINTSICYKLCGYKNVISLFREDAIEYQQAIGASSIKIFYFMLQEICAVRMSNKIIVQCENDRKRLILRNKKFCKNVDKKVFVQINNANASWMQPYTREQVEKSDEKIKILFVGDFSNERKGHGILLPAVEKLIHDGYDIYLMIAGDGSELDKYKELYGKYKEIEFLGRVKDMGRYLSIADFEIVPSLIDSCPNTVLEALNAGVAVYGANTGGIPDLLQEKKYLFESNSHSIYCFLKEIIETRRYIDDAVNQSKQRKWLQFDWSQRIKDIIENH